MWFWFLFVFFLISPLLPAKIAYISSEEGVSLEMLAF